MWSLMASATSLVIPAFLLQLSVKNYRPPSVAAATATTHLLAGDCHYARHGQVFERNLAIEMAIPLTATVL